MKWILLLIFLHSTGRPMIVLHDFNSEAACEAAKTAAARDYLEINRWASIHAHCIKDASP